MDVEQFFLELDQIYRNFSGSPDAQMLIAEFCDECEHLITVDYYGRA